MTGIPVRTLHYYDEADLLKPNRQASGHRIPSKPGSSLDL
ncbi:MerR family DNA-binding transcriptional regulator [Paenibacillus sp. PAMC21692]|nr:MerR family DNA-binding transcriptional regulator [Paenibacillus sp. PAMC21692]QNK59546.1 MerR family DNA-binding transcriptional regulator [Paenibacillus sp. PAMC21692]